MITFKRDLKATIVLIRRWLAAVVCVTGFVGTANDYPWLAELDAGSGVKAYGLRLMNLDLGLHPLERNAATATKLLIGVHGFGSEGYEWVYPLQTLDDDNTSSFFYRWNTFQCTSNAGTEMARLLGSALADYPHIESVKIIGHSYGGLMAIGFIEHWTNEIPTQIHAVAAPLAGTGNGCENKLPGTLSPTIKVTQWRTIQALDNAFKDWPADPQIVDITGSAVMRLPKTYRGRRLGQNWSISWVAENILTREPT